MKRYTIGVLIGNANSPHTKSLMRGIHNAAEKMNVDVIFFLGVHMTFYYHAYFQTQDGSENTYDYQYNVVFDYALLAEVDALIISYGSLCIFLEDKNKDHFLKKFKGIPYVLLEERDNNAGTCIISDNYNGMYRLMEHLLKDHGYHRFTFLAGPLNNTDANERKQAFIDALHAYQIPFCEDMIEVGDFSECVDEQIETLLSRYPDMEAMVCANDVMAEKAYKVCAAHGLTVGKNIAVTGYDDWNMAESMSPPLTTVLQNEFDMGYNALECAYKLCENQEPMTLLAPATLKIRSSCGCMADLNSDFPVSLPSNTQENEQYVQQVADTILHNILLSNINGEIKEGVSKQLHKIIENNLKAYQQNRNYQPDNEDLMAQMNELIAGRYGEYISSAALTESAGIYLRSAIAHETDEKKVTMLSDFLVASQKYIQSSVVKKIKDELDDFQQDAMFMPLISRDMMNNIENEQQFYEAPMKILSAMRSKSAYLFILEEPVHHLYGDVWKRPERIYLASGHVNGKIFSYAAEDRPVITKRKGLSQIFNKGEGYVVSTFNLFLGGYQYGILAAEINPADMILFHLASLQISSALNFHVVYQQQHLMRMKLETLIEEVNEKNKILGFISEYDELTRCLNRRGFMEKAVSFIHKNEGLKAVVILCDLDHLKEINDCFGHVEGDFAIKKSAEVLREILGQNTLLARIGGDEFITIFPYDEKYNGKYFVQKLREANYNFNCNSEKPYYIEISAGYTEFVCNPARDFNSIMADADLILYEAKKKRRSTIRKVVPNNVNQ